MAKTASGPSVEAPQTLNGRRGQRPAGTGRDSATTPERVTPEGGSKRVQLQLNAEEYQLLEEVKRGMTVARNQTDTVILSLKFVRWILSLQSQGYKLAMVKDDRVEAVQLFM
jgi:hypothetical protein